MLQHGNSRSRYDDCLRLLLYRLNGYISYSDRNFVYLHTRKCVHVRKCPRVQREGDIGGKYELHAEVNFISFWALGNTTQSIFS